MELKFNTTKMLFISLAAALCLGLIIMFSISAQQDKMLEAGFKERLTRMGYSFEKLECFHKASAKVCEADNVISERTDSKMDKIRITNPEGAYELTHANKKGKIYFSVELLNMQTKDGEPLLLNAFKGTFQNYEIGSLTNPEETEKLLNKARKEVSPLNMLFRVNAETTEEGAINNAKATTQINAGKDIELLLSIDDGSIDDVKKVIDPNTFAKAFKFSKVSFAGKLPNDVNGGLDEKSKKEAMDSFEAQSATLAELYGLDENMTSSLKKKLQNYLNDEVFKFKVTLINTNRDDLEWVIGSFAKAFFTGELKLNGELLKNYKIELE